MASHTKKCIKTISSSSVPSKGPFAPAVAVYITTKWVAILSTQQPTTQQHAPQAGFQLYLRTESCPTPVYIPLPETEHQRKKNIDKRESQVQPSQHRNGSSTDYSGRSRPYTCRGMPHVAFRINTNLQFLRVFSQLFAFLIASLVYNKCIYLFGSNSLQHHNVIDKEFNKTISKFLTQMFPESCRRGLRNDWLQESRISGADWTPPRAWHSRPAKYNIWWSWETTVFYLNTIFTDAQLKTPAPSTGMESQEDLRHPDDFQGPTAHG